MSLTHYIIYKNELEISALEQYLSSINNAAYESRGENVLYFWIEGKSTRGFDITFEEGYIAVRNTFLSNKCDYDLTNKIVEKILSLTAGFLIDEDERQILSFPLFDDTSIAQIENYDCKTIYDLAQKHEDIAIDGPVRAVHFGQRLHKELNGLDDEALKAKIFDIILDLNYKIPNFEYGHIIQMGADDDKKRLKLITNKVNCIIDKYDYVLLNKDEKEEQAPIMITNTILNTILPSSWKLMDEFTIIAPIINEEEWSKLLLMGEKHDLSARFFQ